MKRKILSLLTLILGIVSCSTEGGLNIPTSNEKVRLNASVETTRTTLGEDLSVLWSEEDAISVYGIGANSSNTFTIVEGAGSNTAAFEGYLPQSALGYIAGYPANIWSEDGTTIEVPHEQQYISGSFANNSNPMIALFDKEDRDISFRNLFGILKLQLVGSGEITSIELSNSSTPMCGSYSIDTSNFGITAISENKSITLANANVTLSAEPETFYILLPPATYQNLEVKVNYANGEPVVRTAEQDITITRNEILPLEAIDVTTEPYTPLVSATVNNELSSWNTVTFDIAYQEDCVDAYIGWAYTSDLEATMGNNPEWSYLDLFTNWLSHNALNGQESYSIIIRPNIEYTLILLGFDSNGDWNTYEFTYESTYNFSNSLALDIVVNEVTTDSFDLTINYTEEIKHIYYKCFSGDYAAAFDQDPQLYITNLNDFRPIAVSETSFSANYTNLPSNTSFTFVCMVEDANCNVAATYEIITTPAYNYADISFEFGEHTRSDTYVTQEIITDCAYYKYAVVTTEELYSYKKEYWEQLLHSSNYPTSSAELLTIDHLRAETDYAIIILPYDSNNQYGMSYALTTATLAPIDRGASEVYNSYLGSWNISFYDEKNQYYENAANITIEAEYPGSSYIIRGLSLGRSDSDEVRAYLINDKLTLIAGERFHNITATNLNIGFGIFSMVTDNGDIVREAAYLEGNLEGNSITFSSSIGSVDWSFIEYYDTDGNLLGYFPPTMRFSVWNKIEPNTTGATTESFVLGNSLNVGWR